VSAAGAGGDRPDPRQPSEHWPLDWWRQTYALGWFPMANPPGTALELCRSRSRALLPLDGRFHIPRSLRRWLRRDCFRLSLNQAFDGVVAGCAARPSTWISPELVRLYHRFHSAGLAHSVEVWEGSDLVGGLLAISFGACWIGESMFHRSPNATSVLLVRLVEGLRQGGFQLFDVQLSNPHLERFGCYTVSDGAYGALLEQARRQPANLRLGQDAIASEAWMRE